ncbi:hypothetical protein [Azohydromonas lata]|uniref:Uncharacterized protein n=1 Tax=Azohydromonas lata TaxID=45677 RepID=A0ABU5IDQ4_9BURK|nr:hypothetical protein [Azohydromonas lata]MDZ5457226.1 hypothetical protein [Azohydromonas lata]
MFGLVEQTIRFRLVQWGKAYVDLLRFALVEAGYEDKLSQIYDFSLALELGVSTSTGRTLVEMGLSRITASNIAVLMLDSSKGVKEIKEWFAGKPESLLQLSNIVIDELKEKGLLESSFDQIV